MKMTITQFWSAQRICRLWALDCFGKKIVDDKAERAKRMLEEAMELAQASGLTESDAHDLAVYVWGRPTGEVSQEIAGVLVTTLILSGTHDVDAGAALQTEIDRIHRPEMMAKIRKKQVSKEVAGIGSGQGVPT